MSNTWDFTVEYSILASPERVYAVWLDGSDRRGPWVGDGERKIDARVGGLIYWSERNFADSGVGGGQCAHYGRFLRLEPSRLIEYAFMSQETVGLDSVIRVELRPEHGDRHGFTKVSLTQSGLPDNGSGYEHENAWARILREMGVRFGGDAGSVD